MVCAFALLFFQLLFTTILCFTPPPRDSGAAMLVNSTIWFFGGSLQPIGGEKATTNSLFSLDVSRPWSISSPPWTDHSSDLTDQSLVYTRGKTTLQLDADGVTLWVYGGKSEPRNASLANSNPTVRYDTMAHVWSSVPPSDNPAVLNLHSHSAARDSQGVIFYFGGTVNNFTGWSSTVENKNVIILSTSTRSWTTLPIGNAPSRILGTATMVGTKVYLIGGTGETMGSVSMYDTIVDTWSTINTKGPTPESRSGHSAVLSSDNTSIIIYGGGTPTAYSVNEIWTLDVNTFQWASPPVTGFSPTKGLLSHNGSFQGVAVDPITYTNTTYVLDTSNWNWTNSFTPMSPENSPLMPSLIPHESGFEYQNPLNIIGGIGGVIGIISGALLLLAVACFLIFLSCRQRNEGVSVAANTTWKPEAVGEI
ncbi:hypothetical protein BC936DRAFT_139575 [Jimgerdemannia flammicorona]|uniref:Galactose oxidase n=1 Tax=Jimgerdemannia flammicorona TaxID=994334 RepID=A0A433B9K0_9FUNG|nr:hypothetical protein BC936DRAFT_139575 [Jimgerdemannia flammicorona]